MTFLKSPRTREVAPGDHSHPIMARFTRAVLERRSG